jgi:hypothetical protein
MCEVKKALKKEKKGEKSHRYIPTARPQEMNKTGHAQPLHGGLFPRELSFPDFGFGTGSRLLRRLPEWPRAVPGRVVPLAVPFLVSIPSLSRTLELPPKLCLFRGADDRAVEDDVAVAMEDCPCLRSLL